MAAAAVAGMLALPSLARAGDQENFLIGPLFGFVLGGKGGAVFGIEGGAGVGPERVNLGYSHRQDKGLFYIELDPWLYVGGTLGIGVEDDGKTFHPVLGVWEGYPVIQPTSCSDWGNTVTIAGGYRYTGVHELYVTIKAGQMQGRFCFD